MASDHPFHAVLGVDAEKGLGIAPSQATGQRQSLHKVFGHGVNHRVAVKRVWRVRGGAPS